MQTLENNARCNACSTNAFCSMGTEGSLRKPGLKWIMTKSKLWLMYIRFP